MSAPHKLAAAVHIAASHISLFGRELRVKRLPQLLASRDRSLFSASRLQHCRAFEPPENRAHEALASAVSTASTLITRL